MYLLRQTADLLKSAFLHLSPHNHDEWLFTEEGKTIRITIEVIQPEGYEWTQTMTAPYENIGV